MVWLCTPLTAYGSFYSNIHQAWGSALSLLNCQSEEPGTAHFLFSLLFSLNREFLMYSKWFGQPSGRRFWRNMHSRILQGKKNKTELPLEAVGISDYKVFWYNSHSFSYCLRAIMLQLELLYTHCSDMHWSMKGYKGLRCQERMSLWLKCYPWELKLLWGF